jgi:sugar phosphate isomerase/epimerase
VAICSSMIGSQVYPHAALLNDLPAYCRTMAAMGVTRLELCSPIGYGADFASLTNGNEVRRILADHGMKSESAHFSLKELRGKQAESIVWAQTIGVTQMLTASLGPGNGGSAPTLDQVKRAAEEYNGIAAVAAQAGMQQGLHNETFERSMVEGKRAYDWLFELLDPELVTFQFQMSEITGGMDGAAYFAKYPGRFTSVHIQDIDMNAPARPQVAVGTGSIDWVTTLRAAKAAGVRSYYVEQTMDLTIESVAALRAMNV